MASHNKSDFVKYCNENARCPFIFIIYRKKMAMGSL